MHESANARKRLRAFAFDFHVTHGAGPIRKMDMAEPNAPNLFAECLLMIRLLARGSLNHAIEKGEIVD